MLRTMTTESLLLLVGPSSSTTTGYSSIFHMEHDNVFVALPWAPPTTVVCWLFVLCPWAFNLLNRIISLMA
jgi:hypothetical protein